MGKGIKHFLLAVFCIFLLVPVVFASIGTSGDYNSQTKFSFVGYDSSSDSGHNSRGSDQITGSFSMSTSYSGRFGILRYCGNSVIDGGEGCDGVNLNNETCLTRGFGSGTLSCNSNCSFDTSACTTLITAAVAGQGGGGAAGRGYILPSLELSQNLIKAIVKQGETKTVELKIKNPADTAQTVSIDLQDLKKFVLLSEQSFTLKPYEEKTITLDFTASQTEPAEVHTGKIIVKTESGQQIIRLILEILERKPLFDILTKIPEELKKVKQGEEIGANIILYNLGDLMPVDVTLSYAIKDFENNTIELKQETFAVEEQKKLERKIKIPEYLKPDFYTFYTLVEYDGQRAVSTDVFEVEEKIEEKLSWKKVLERLIISLLALITIAALIALAHLVIKVSKNLSRLCVSGRVTKEKAKFTFEEKNFLTKIEEIKKLYIRREKPPTQAQLIDIDKFLNKIEKEKIEEYIQQKLEEGYTEKRIIEAARKSGWDEKLVKSLLEEAKTKPV